MKLFRFIKKRDVVIFLLGAILFGGVGTVVATNIASSSVNYTTSKNANVENVEDALDDLYDQIIGHPIACYKGTCGKLSYRYWNNNFAGDTGVNLFDSTHMPSTAYATRALLEQNYGSSNFANSPVYIRSILINENVVGHQVCIWLNNKEFCRSTGYWAGTINTPDTTAAAQTKIKLQRDMEQALGVTINDSSCYSYSVYSGCNFNGFRCNNNSDGDINCYSINTDVNCYVYGNDTAYCK